jgi:hypothetical protein
VAFSLRQIKYNYLTILSYWDWTLDWEDLTRSAIWDTDAGFGGNGNPDQRSTTDNGYCMEAGPYASLRPQYYASHACPHCLSRNFTKIDTQRLRPDMVDKVMESSDYETLFIALEKGPHNVIPNMIGGDFLTFTAPNGMLSNCLFPETLAGVLLTKSQIRSSTCTIPKSTGSGGFGSNETGLHVSTSMAERPQRTAQSKQVLVTQSQWVDWRRTCWYRKS